MMLNDVNVKSKRIKHFSTESYHEALTQIKHDDKALRKLQSVVNSIWFNQNECTPEYKEKILALAQVVREQKLYDPGVRKKLLTE